MRHRSCMGKCCHSFIELKYREALEENRTKHTDEGKSFSRNSELYNLIARKYHCGH